MYSQCDAAADSSWISSDLTWPSQKRDYQGAGGSFSIRALINEQFGGIER